MKKVLNVFLVLLLLVYLAFFVLVCHSALTQLSLGPAAIPGLGIGSSGTIASAAPESAAEPAASVEPVSTAVSRGSGVQLSSGAWPEDAGEITAVLNAADIPLLDRFENLYLLICENAPRCFCDVFRFSSGRAEGFLQHTVAFSYGSRPQPDRRVCRRAEGYALSEDLRSGNRFC